MKLELNLSQKQLVTQQMIQTLNILEMNVLQLESYIEELSLENPLIDPEESEAKNSEQRRELLKQSELERKLEWLSSGDRQNSVYYESDESGDPGENLRDISDEGEDLAGYLRAQLLLKGYDANERRASEYLLASLDSRGYFTDDTESAARCLSLPRELIQRLTDDIRALDPAGVGAFDLKDCLLLQLHRKERVHPLSEVLILRGLEDIAKNHIEILARKLGAAPEDISAACAEIRSLNPKPGNAFSDRRRLAYIRPDVVVVKLKNHFEILVNEYQYPRVSINRYYRGLAADPPDAATGKYLKEKLRQAEELQADLANRSSTLSRVARVLVAKQERFFLHGPGNRRPLRLRDIAEELSLHDSTVSRALQHKFLQCTFGIFPLNYFLTSAAATDESSGEAQTPEQIKRCIEEIIAREDKQKPLSDEKISASLASRHISIARRTVTKYRRELGIPDRSGRKRIAP